MGSSLGLSIDNIILEWTGIAINFARRSVRVSLLRAKFTITMAVTVTVIGTSSGSCGPSPLQNNAIQTATLELLTTDEFSSSFPR